MQPHLRPRAGAERAQQIAHRLQRLAVDVQLRPARRAAEAGAEVGQLLAVERQDVGLQRLEAAPLHLGAERGDVVVGAQRRHADQLVVAHAVGAAMRPVDRDALAHRPAEQLVDRHAERLALDVEQRVLDRGDGARVHPARRLHLAHPQHRGDLLHRPRVRARSAVRPGRGSRAVRPRLPSASVYSDQPTSPSSVVSLRNENVRQPASQCRSSILASFMTLLPSLRRVARGGTPGRRRADG